MTKERPIRFSGPMVRAILAGKKTQTRRVCKWPKEFTECCNNPKRDYVPHGPTGEHPDWPTYMRISYCESCDALGARVGPPWEPGDVLWVKETWGFHSGGAIVTSEEARPNAWNKAGFGGKGCWSPVVYKAGTEDFAWGMYGPPKWRSSLFMPRSASRLSLVIRSVRVERVQDISEADAMAEGCNPGNFTEQYSAVPVFADLWDSINGKTHPWASNPLVWVLEFEVQHAAL